MIIKSIHLKSYGQFENKKITFQDKLNVIYGENESGKTTISTALKTFFYKNLLSKYKYKKNYIPINEKSASYEVNFGLENQEEYETQITLGQTNAKTIYKTIKKPLQTEINMGDASIGEYFLGLKEDLFDSVSYMKDLSSYENLIINDKEVHETLSHITADHILDVDLSLVLEKIKNEIMILQRKTNSGKLYPLKMELEEIENQLYEFSKINETVIRYEEERKREEQTLKEKEAHLIQNEKQFSHLKDYLAYKNYEEQIKLRERIEKLREEYNQLDTPQFEISSDELSKLIDLENKINYLSTELLKEPLGDSRKNKITILKKSYIAGITLLIFSVLAALLSPYFLILSFVFGIGIGMLKVNMKKVLKLQEKWEEAYQKTKLLEDLKKEQELSFQSYQIGSLSEYYQKNKEYNDCIAKRSMIDKEIALLTEQIKEIDLKQFENLIISVPTATMEELNHKRSQLTEEISGLKLKINSIQERKKSMFNNLPDFELLVERKEELLTEISKLEEQLKIAETAFHIMNLTKDNYKASYLPALNEETITILREISNINLDRLILKDNLLLELRKKDENHFKGNEYLSSGTRDIIYFAMRLAVYNLAFANQEKIPLILDDCFLELDDVRFLKCMQYLIKKTNMQIFYFTAHKRIFDLPLENDAKYIL